MRHDGAICRVVDDGVDGARAEFELDTSRAAEGNLDGVGSAQKRCAALCVDASLVGDVRSQQRHIAAPGVDVSLVDDSRCRCVALELHIAGQKIGVGNAQGAGGECAGADATVLAKKDAIGVHQNHLAIGMKLAEDGTGL